MAEIYVGNTGYNWILSCEETSFSQSIENNTSTLGLTLYLRCETGSNNEWVSASTWGANIGGNGFSPEYKQLGSKHAIGSASYTITHNADGTANFSVGYGISSTYALNGSGTFSKSLPTIPRASSIGTITGDTMGSAITVPISRASNSFTHDVTYTFGKISRKYTGQGTSCVFTPPISDATQVPNTTYGTATIKVQTKSGSTNVGSAVSKTFLLKIHSSVVPSFTSIGVEKIDNGVPSAWNMYVSGFSKVKLSVIGATSSYGSAIKGYSISGANYSSKMSSLTTGVLSAGTFKFTATILDSRGRSASRTVSITVNAYNVPKLKLTARRCNSAGVVDSDGTYILVKPEYSCTVLGAKNSIVARKFEIVGTSYNNTTCASGSGCIIGSGAVLTSKSYIVKGTVTDELGKSAVFNVSVTTASKPFNIKANGKGAAFGKMAEADGVLDVVWDIKSKGNRLVTQPELENNLIKGTYTGSINGLYEQGNYWCNFSEVSGSPYTSGYGWLEIIKASPSNVCIQKIYRFNNGITQIVIRPYINSQWYAWRTVATVA